MATSTEATVRAEIVTAVQGIAVSDLGFKSTGGIKAYLLEFHQDDQPISYLMNEVTGKQEKELRAVGIQVLRSDDLFFDHGGNAFGTYFTTFELYYDVDRGGAGVNRLIDAARKIRNSIKTLGLDLDGTVDRTESPTELDISVVSTPEEIKEDTMLLGQFTMISERSPVDF